MFYEPSFWFSVNNFVLLKCTAHTFKYERERERGRLCFARYRDVFKAARYKV